MDKDFMQYVYARIEKTLEENKGYMDLQSKLVKAQQKKDSELASDILGQLESMAEELCYIKGFNDAMQIMISSKESR